MEREIKRAEATKARAASEYVAQVGDKITQAVASWRCATSWETQWGYTYVYEVITSEGNVLIWKTSKVLDADFDKISGTVKAHNEYRGVKQTELTRCKVA